MFRLNDFDFKIKSLLFQTTVTKQAVLLFLEPVRKVDFPLHCGIMVA